MGLVTCSKCRKVYDYDKYSGICPKCARYNSANMASQEHQSLHDQYDSGYSHNAHDDHYSYHQKYDENKNPHEIHLEDAQKTLKEMAGTVRRTITSPTNDTINSQQEKKKMDKRTKIILAIILIGFGINIILPILFAAISFIFVLF